MKDLPHKFQMRTYGFPGFTHTVKMNGWGDYEVTWARGFDRLCHSMGGSLPNKVFDVDKVKKLVKDCEWFVIEDKTKQENSASALPDEFCFQVQGEGDVYTMRKERDGYCCTDRKGGSGWHSDKFVKDTIKEGVWKIIDKKPLTPEQEKRVKEFKERIFQLDNSIRTQEQNIEHVNRLVENYKGQQEDLRKMIKELEGSV